MPSSYGLSLVCRCAKLVFVLLSVLFVQQLLLAQTPQLLKDINPTQDVASSGASQFTAVGNLTFFTTYIPGEGYQLWKTDGTPSGTTPVINRYLSRASNLTSSNGKLFFVAQDNTPLGITILGGAISADLWVSDGTAAGTKMLRPVTLPPSAPIGGGGVLADVNGLLFFASDDGAAGKALWKTDGTDAGTVMVKAIPASCPLGSLACATGLTYAPSLSSLTAVNATLFFATGTNGYFPADGALWKSDGTEAGTVMLTSGSLLPPTNLINVNGELFFTTCEAENPSGCLELWKSDGTPAGTVAILPIVSGTGVTAQEFTNVNGTLFFRTQDTTPPDYATKLWKSDGTAEGTVVLLDICSSSCSMSASYLTNLNGTLFYSALNGLWKSDGTPAGTVQIAIGIMPSDLAVLNGALYFAAYDATNGRELWVSDGTANGTQLLKDVCPGTCSGVTGTSRLPLLPADGSSVSDSFVRALLTPVGLPRRLSVSNGRLYFSGCDLVNQCEPWSSDGTNVGTSLLKNIALNTASEITGAVDFNRTLLFSAFDGTALKLWHSDGTDGGTAVLSDVVADMRSTVTLNGTLFFAGRDSAHGYELWKTDGTDAGTVMVNDINPGTASSQPSSFFTVNGAVLFFADDGTHGAELWKTDGTAAGTGMVKDINPSGSSTIGTLLVPPISMAGITLAPAVYGAVVSGTLFFAATDGTVAGLWKSDGTEAGTIQVAAFPPPPTSTCGLGPASLCGPTNLVNVNGTLFFTANQGELWKSDGTSAGTVVVDAALPRASSLTNVNGTLFFVTGGLAPVPPTGSVFTVALWKTDGTANGTVIVKDFGPNLPVDQSSTGIAFSSLSIPSNLTNVNGTLFFTAPDNSNNLALWKSDGSTEGTVIVKDAPASQLASVNGRLYFASADDTHGTELWRSDGTASGTTMVADINPGANGSFPQVLATSHGRMFFTANDGTHGTELWTLTVASTTVSLATPANAAVVGTPVTLKATVSSIVPGTFSGKVNFFDTGTPLASVAVDANGVATLTTSSLTTGNHALTATYSGDAYYPDGATANAAAMVILATAPDYTLAAIPPSQTIRAGESATFVITATADQYFNGTITFACGTLPKGVTCSFSHPTLNPVSASPAQTMLTISTTSRSAALQAPARPGYRRGEGVFWASITGVGAFGCLFAGGLSRRKRVVLFALVFALLALGLTSCGAPSNPNGTPRGSFTVQVTATATPGTTGGNTASHQLPITITVQ